MKKIKQQIVALPDLLSLELSLVVIIGLVCGMILASGLSLIANFNIVFIPALILAFLSFGFNSFNAVFDKYLDSVNRPKRPIPSNVYSPKEAFVLSLVFFCSAIVLALQFSSSFYLACSAFVLLAVVHSLPPMYLKGVAYIGTLISSFMYGVLPVLAGFVLFLPAELMPLSYLTITFLFALSAISLKDFETYLGDRQYSVRTFPVLFGKKNAVNITTILLILPYALILLLALAGIFSTNAILVSLLGFWALMLSRSFYYDSSKENSKMVLSQAMLLSMLASLFLALILAA